MRSPLRSMTVAAATVLLTAPALTTVAQGAPTPAAQGRTAPTKADTASHKRGPLPGGFKNLVVIYQENHSFDNLYGSWGKAGRDRVDGLDSAPRATSLQVKQNGQAYRCLPQTDVNLAGVQPKSCTGDPDVGPSAFTNDPFNIEDLIKPTDKTCAAPGTKDPATGVPKDSAGAVAGGCTSDMVHRFYTEQYQLNGGAMNRYVTGSDAAGLTMGHYDTRTLPIYRYLHDKGAPNYVIADRFFAAAFGGSFLNHQFLISARAPLDTSAGAMGAKTSVVDANGMAAKTTMYTPTTTDVVDGQLTKKCADGSNDRAKASGNFAVNTTQPGAAPFGKGAQMPLIDNAQFPNIGDRLSAKGVSWAWYAGGWDDAAAGKPGPLFQFHHQPFAYFKNTAPGAPGRDHLRDETKFLSAAKSGTLPAVSFVKPYGESNEQPGYASATDGSEHLVTLLKAVMDSPQADDTLVVVTYDEFGGQWDHVPPPGQGTATTGVSDAWGPGTRIPALVLSKRMTRSGVDSTVYDTTSILATLEKSYGLEPLSSRDAHVAPLDNAVAKGMGKGHQHHGRKHHRH